MRHTNATRGAGGRFDYSTKPKAKPVQVWIQPHNLELLDQLAKEWDVGRGKVIDRLIEATQGEAPTQHAAQANSAESEHIDYVCDSYIESDDDEISLDIDLILCQRSHPDYQRFRNRHYIANNGCHGQQLHYLIQIDGQLRGIISGASAAYGVRCRDEFFNISKDKALRHAQLSSIVSNVVYRLEDAPRNAATQTLALWRKRIAADWQHLYGVTVAGFETYVIEGSHNDRNQVITDKHRTGALYRADNWEMPGITSGSTKTHATELNSGGLQVSHARKATTRKLVFAKKVKGVALASRYTPTWNNREAQREMRLRRQLLLSQDAARLNAIGRQQRTPIAA